MTVDEILKNAELRGAQRRIAELEAKLAKVEAESADKDSALADCGIVLDVMAFSLVFARMFVQSEPLADACLSQIKCGLDAYLSVVGGDALMTEIAKNSAASIDNQDEEV